MFLETTIQYYNKDNIHINSNSIVNATTSQSLTFGKITKIELKIPNVNLAITFMVLVQQDHHRMRFTALCRLVDIFSICCRFLLAVLIPRQRL